MERKNRIKHRFILVQKKVLNPCFFVKCIFHKHFEASHIYNFKKFWTKISSSSSPFSFHKCFEVPLYCLGIQLIPEAAPCEDTLAAYQRRLSVDVPT